MFVVEVDGDAGGQGSVEDVLLGVGELVKLGGDPVRLARMRSCSLWSRSRDQVGVVGVDEFEAFGFELVALGGQELAFVLAGSFELAEDVVKDLPHVCRHLPPFVRRGVLAVSVVVVSVGHDPRA